MSDGRYLIYLNDCFAAGYTMPQFCIDNEIKKPLFVLSDSKHWQIFWSIHVQFTHDKRIKPKFVILNGKDDSVRLSPGTLFDELKIEDSDGTNFEDCDKIFFLTSQENGIDSDKIIYLDELLNEFILTVYVETPFLHFLQSHPKIKLFLTNFPLISINPYNTGNEKKIIQENTPLATFAERLRKDKTGEVKTPYDFWATANKI